MEANVHPRVVAYRVEIRELTTRAREYRWKLEGKQFKITGPPCFERHRSKASIGSGKNGLARA